MYQKNDITSIARNVIDSLYLTIMINNECKIIYVTRSYADILGFTQQELIGADIHKIIPTTKLPQVIKMQKPIYAEPFELRNGELVICNRLPVFDEKDNIVGAISLASFDNLNLLDKLNSELALLKSKNQIYKQQLDSLKSLPTSGKNIIGNSLAMNKLKVMIEQIAHVNIPILLTGETGVGKEVIASAIHFASNRKDKNYIKINCAAIPKDLLESELFGYEAGAFSGASKQGKLGKLEVANKGTILLDEIGEMSLDLQSKLLRVLQEKEFERVGGIRPIPVDVRIICSTNQEIEQLIEAGKFRKDLYYRINTVEIEIPPLRERISDIKPLCHHFIEKFNKIHGCKIIGIESNVIEMFETFNWPGNIRQLEHVVERACVTTFTGILNFDSFQFFIDTLSINKKAETSKYSFQKQKHQTEKIVIISALESTNGNKTAAAKLLQISRSLLYKKIKQYDLS